MKVIGFANKFYTLWEVTESTTPSEINGMSVNTIHYEYIKNISFDLETAINKYPNATIDETLKGKTVSFNNEKTIWTTVDTYRFGKYLGKKIEDVNDINYLSWYITQITDASHIEYCENILVSNGYNVIHSNDEYILVESPEEHKANIERKAKAMAFLDKLKSGNPLVVSFDRNLDIFGYGCHDEVFYKFHDFTIREYNGFEYALPVLNGKAKRIKGKNIEISEYEYKYDESVSRVYVLVNKFNIIK